ncbi:MAG: DUF1887 family CARF protein [Victivallaceae bacterium]|nr:DUF1887 family CARF protein [Victivallaceae bacterium]MDD5663614.1 DUF1887 family CARF protein [Victivallaceae bacterium]
MKRFKTHVILVSDQVTPNATPVMDDQIRPEKVILCVTKSMKPKAAILKKFFESKKIICEEFELGPAYHFDIIKDRFLELATRLVGDSQNIALNLTGGTKLMTIAALTSFQDDFACFYVIPEEANICMINRNEPIYAISEQMKLEDFFGIHGYQVTAIERRKTISSDARKLFDELLEHYHEFKDAIGELNYNAMIAESNRTMNVKNDIQEKSWGLLKCFMKHGAISYFDDKKITFNGPSGRKFCQGFWLEDYVYLALAAVKEQLQDFAVSISIKSASDTKNEIDAAFLLNNRLYLIECKTANLKKNADALYKMDSVHALTGLRTQPVLISYLPLDKHSKQRAKDLKIQLCEGQEMKKLSSLLLEKMT